MIPRQIDSINAEDILALVENQEEERRTLDFKRELPDSSDKSKHALRADVTSFANTAGGDLIFGVEEKGGVAVDVCGLGSMDPDAEIRRIESILQSGIEPRLHGVRCHTVSIDGKGCVLIVRIPRSWHGPHLVRINEGYRVYGRTSKGNYPYDASEIRRALTQTTQLSAQIRAWRSERIAKIVCEDTPSLLLNGSQLVLHVVPLASFENEYRFSAVELRSIQNVWPMGSCSWATRVNLDGVIAEVVAVTGNEQTKRHSGYVQFYRSGRFEFVDELRSHGDDPRPVLPSQWYEEVTIDSTEKVIQALNNRNLPPPYFVFLSLTRAKSIRFGVDAWRHDNVRAPDRDTVLLPEAVIDEIPCNVGGILRPIFDAVWNTFGITQSDNYDQDGNWVKR